MANLQCTPIRAYDALPPLDKSFLISYNVSDLDNVTGYGVVQNFNGLINSDASCKELDHISSFENNVGVVSLPGCSDRHGTIDKIEDACYTLSKRAQHINLQVTLCYTGRSRGIPEIW